MKNWWKDRLAKGMEEALNSLADLIANLFKKAGQSGDGSGGGIFGAIGTVLGGVFGSKSSIGKIDTSSWGAAGTVSLGADTSGLPRFNTGGSFKVGGMSGIDRNVVSMKLSRGEMVDIRKPGNDNGGAGGRFIVEPSPWFDVRAANAAEPGIQSMGVRAAAGGAQMAGTTAAKRRRRSLAGG